MRVGQRLQARATFRREGDGKCATASISGIGSITGGAGRPGSTSCYGAFARTKDGWRRQRDRHRRVIRGPVRRSVRHSFRPSPLDAGRSCCSRPLSGQELVDRQCHVFADRWVVVGQYDHGPTAVESRIGGVAHSGASIDKAAEARVVAAMRGNRTLRLPFTTFSASRRSPQLSRSGRREQLPAPALDQAAASFRRRRIVPTPARPAAKRPKVTGSGTWVGASNTRSGAPPL